MKVETLQKVLEKIPDDYEILFQHTHIKDTFEVDIIEKKLVLK